MVRVLSTVWQHSVCSPRNLEGSLRWGGVPTRYEWPFPVEQQQQLKWIKWWNVWRWV